MASKAHGSGAGLAKWLQRLPRPASGVPGLTLVVAAFITVFLNNVFWKTVIAEADIGVARHLGFGLALAAAFCTSRATELPSRAPCGRP